MTPQVISPAGEDGVERPLAEVERNQDRGPAPAGDRERSRLLRIQQPAGQRDPQTLASRIRPAQGTSLMTSTRSSNMTSPSSTRWIGHLAAMVRRRSTCSSLR